MPSYRWLQRLEANGDPVYRWLPAIGEAEDVGPSATVGEENRAQVDTADATHESPVVHTADAADANPAQEDNASATHEAPVTHSASAEESNRAQVDAATAAHEEPLPHSASVAEENPAQSDESTASHDATEQHVASVAEANPVQLDSASARQITPIPIGTPLAIWDPDGAEWIAVEVAVESGHSRLVTPRVESTRSATQELAIHRTPVRGYDDTWDMATPFGEREDMEPIRDLLRVKGPRTMAGVLIGPEPIEVRVRRVRVTQGVRIGIIAVSFQVVT